MAYAGKTYKHEKDENFSDFVKSLGLPAEREAMFLNYKPSQKLEKDGDNYNLVSISPNGTKEVKFKNGVAFTEEVGDGHVSKTTFTLNGNCLTQVQKFEDDRDITFKRDYTDSQLVVTITSNVWDGTARRYYIAV